MSTIPRLSRPLAQHAALLPALLAALISQACADGSPDSAGTTTAAEKGNADNAAASDTSSGWQNPNNSGGTAASDAGSSAMDAASPGPYPDGDFANDAGATEPMASDTAQGDSGADGSADAKLPDAAPVCDKTAPVVLYLSADDSNSMASATVARGLILQGQYAYKPVRA